MVQFPPEQPGVPFRPLHEAPHALQFATLVLRLVSHPSVRGLPLQSPKPVLQEMLQMLLVQAGVPFRPLHAALHAPQLGTELVRFVSQPFDRALPSQFPQPALHTMEQALALQVGTPLLALHGWLHPPQFVSDEVRSVSQPLVMLPSQLPQPPLHRIWH